MRKLKKLLDFFRRMALKIIFVLGIIPCSAFCDGRRIFKIPPLVGILSLTGYAIFLVWTGSWPDTLGATFIALFALQIVIARVWHWMAERFWRQHREILCALQPKKEDQLQKDSQKTETQEIDKTFIWTDFLTILCSLILLFGLIVCIGSLVVCPALYGSESFAVAMGIFLSFFAIVLVAAILWTPLVGLMGLLNRKPGRFDECFCQTTSDTKTWIILNLMRPYNDDEDDEEESAEHG